MSSDEQPVAAIATAIAPSALAAIRVSGESCVELLSGCFSRSGALRSAAGHTLHHGVIATADGEPVDEVVVAVYRRPRSYTGEESAEIFCHGSPAGVRRVYGVLLQAGFAQAAPGEFTRRAFLNGKLDLTRAEAVNEIVQAQTATAHSLALDRLGGGVEREVRSLRADLVDLMAQLAIELDYPEEETGPIDFDRARLVRAGERCRRLAGTFERGRLYQDGARVALAGRTNAGKSSLFNRLLQQDRSIVSEVHGTTRDYVEVLIDVGGVPVRLFDTAGLRTAGEAVEEEGVRRSKAIIAASDLVIYVVDSAHGLTQDDEERLEEIRRTTPALVALNKADLVSAGFAARPGAGLAQREASAPGPEPASTASEGAVAVSAFTGEGMDELNRRLFERLVPEPATGSDPAVGVVAGDSSLAVGGSGPGGPEPVIDSERQHALLVRAGEAVERTLESIEAGVSADAVAVDLQDALDAIGEITGEVASAEILDAMFESFCVGK